MTLSGFIRGESHHRARAGVGDQHRRAARPDHVQGGLVAGVGHVDGDPEPVHPLDRALAEGGQPAVAPFPQARAERVGLAVGDAHLPHAEAVEDVDPVDLVLDHGGRLEPGHQRDGPGLVRPPEVGQRGGPEHEVLVGEVAEALAEVVDDVVPLPARLAGDAPRAVHEVVEHRGQPGVRQALVAGAVATGADQLEAFGDVVREDRGMVVQRDHQAVRQQPVGPLALRPAQLAPAGGHAAELRRELELLVVASRLEVVERPVAGVARRRWQHPVDLLVARSAGCVADHGRSIPTGRRNGHEEGCGGAGGVRPGGRGAAGVRR
jgi:hypothetical protein